MVEIIQLLCSIDWRSPAFWVQVLGYVFGIVVVVVALDITLHNWEHSWFNIRRYSPRQNDISAHKRELFAKTTL